jgi:4-amino-4-deoxy-L-arabinose transferase-like glycosyltransferase
MAWRIALRLAPRRTAFLGALALLSCPLFVRIGGAAMNDGILTAFFVAAVLLAFRLAEAPSAGRAAALGTVIGFGFLVKYTILLAVPVVAVVLIVLPTARVPLRHVALAALLALLPTAFWLGAAAQIGVLTGQKAWLQRAAGVSLRGSFGERFLLDALVAKLPSALGTYNLPLIALGAAAVLRQRLWQGMLLFAWVALVFVPLILTLPDNRYFLPSFPALALLAAIALDGGARARFRPLLLALVLCALVVAYYLQADVTIHASLFHVKH